MAVSTVTHRAKPDHKIPEMEYSKINLAFRARRPRAAALVERGLTALVVGLAGLNLAGLLTVMALRARFPFELEWIEGGTVTTLQHILSGRFLYGPPSLEFVPLLYLSLIHI